MIAAATVLLAALACVVASAAEGDCMNPLFQLHWAGKSDVRHLLGAPAIRSELELCPFYNGQLGCCSSAFEAELQLAFDRWVAHWRAISQRLRDFRDALGKVQVSPAYVRVTDAERALFDAVLDAMQTVLATHGTCFDTILQYTAGVLCFSCDSHWRSRVLVDGMGPNPSITRILVKDDANNALWTGCEPLSRAATLMRLRVADSRLAKSVQESFDDLPALNSKATLSQMMAEVVGLYVMRGPGEQVLDLTSNRRLQLQNSSGSADLLDAVSDGQRSGFYCDVFPRASLSKGTPVHPSLWKHATFLSIPLLWLGCY